MSTSNLPGGAEGIGERKTGNDKPTGEGPGIKAEGGRGRGKFT